MGVSFHALRLLGQLRFDVDLSGGRLECWLVMGVKYNAVGVPWALFLLTSDQIRCLEMGIELR